MIRARLNRLQTVTAHGQESRRAMGKMSNLNRSRLDTSVCTRRSGSSQLASDEALSRTASHGPDLHCKPTRSTDQLSEVCSSPAPYAQTRRSDNVRLNTVIGISARGSETDVTSERERLHSEGGEDNDSPQSKDGSLERRRLHHKRR